MTAPSAGASYWLTVRFPVEIFSFLPKSWPPAPCVVFFLGAEMCILRWFQSLNVFVCVLAAKIAQFLHIWFGVDLFNVGYHDRSKPLLPVIVPAVSITESDDELRGSCCCGSRTSWARRGGWGWILIFYLPWEDFAALRPHLRSHVHEMTPLLCTPQILHVV